MPEPRTPQSPEPLSWPQWKAQHQQKPWYRRYPLAVEWLFEQVNDRLHRWAFVEFLEHAGKFAVLIAVVVWMLEADNRAKERHYRAWELINSARGSSGDGGRIDALEDLSKDGVSLATTPLERAWLQGVDLQGANLRKANLEGANFGTAENEELMFSGTNLRKANLEGANLRGANLWWANLEGANLEGANLEGANFGTAQIGEWIFAGANLKGANLRKANLNNANLEGARYLTQEQLDSALGSWATRLSNHLMRPAHWPSSKSEELAE